jgi:hypothetical protein
MNIDYNISDEDLKIHIREVMDDAIELTNPEDFADTVMYPQNALKQIIVATIYLSGYWMMHGKKIRMNPLFEEEFYAIFWK